jgi:hypothetical protein
MKTSDIKVGKTYRNRGAGKTQRRVINIGPDFHPDRYYAAERPENFPGVEFWDERNSKLGRLWLDSFASWAGSEVIE